MAPTTRSNGVPQPSRVYHSSPTVQQARFPARRKIVRTYGNRRHSAGDALRQERNNNQSTLTQYDFRASNPSDAGGVAQFSDSEGVDTEDELDKENDGKDRGKAVEGDDDDEEPVPSGRKQRSSIKRQKSKQAPKKTYFEDDRNNSDSEEPSSGKKRAAAPSSKQTDNKNKRRRTMGDELPQNARRLPRGKKTTTADKNRRKTLDDLPTSSATSRYHTQTITQVVRRHGTIKDSEDEDDEEDLNNEENDGFDEWVGAPSPIQPMHEAPFAQQKDDDDTSGHMTGRQESMVPQTPAKKNTRLEIPSSSQLSTPLSSHMLDRYGPPGQMHPTPSKGSATIGDEDQLSELPGSAVRHMSSAVKQLSTRKLVIEDSFATDSWVSTPKHRTPLKDVTASMIPLEEENEDEEDEDEGQKTPTFKSLSKESSSIAEAMSTPSRIPQKRNTSTELGEGDTTPSPRRVTPRGQPLSAKVVSTKDLSNVTEIPDSDEDEDDDDWSQHTADDDQNDNRDKSTEEDATNEEPVQLIQEELNPDEDASSLEQPGNEEQDVNNETYEEEHNGNKRAENSDTFIMGTETQGVFDALSLSFSATSGRAAPALGTIDEEEMIPQSSAASSPPSLPQLRTSLARAQPPKPTRSVLPKPTGKPLRYPIPPSSPTTQFVESQRVPLAVIQALGDVTNETDALVTTTPDQLEQLVSGHRVELGLPFGLPNVVIRLWLFDGTLLRYMTCINARSRAAGMWTYEAGQVYELNNPLDTESIRDEGWANNFPNRWSRIPPAIVSQLLSNLKGALFNLNNEDIMSTQGTTQEQAATSPILLRHSRSTTRQADRTAALHPSASFSSVSVSQQLEAQLRSETEQHTQSLTLPGLSSEDDAVIVPSTPVHERTPRNAFPNLAQLSRPAFTPVAGPSSTLSHSISAQQTISRTPTRRPVQPSQATTVSQASTPEKPSTRQARTPRPRNPASDPPSALPPPRLSENSSLSLPDIPSYYSPVNLTGDMSVSQLLTRSQMLSESLLRDDVQMPPPMEIWDSDEEN